MNAATCGKADTLPDLPLIYPYPGTSWCLDAFIVALSQACEGNGKHWYTSTLQLQLTSLELCSACRSVPTLDVKVNGDSPRGLWALKKKPESNARSSKEVHISSRVLAVRAL